MQKLSLSIWWTCILGQFDITSLSGSFMQSKKGVTGGLNLSMTKPDGSLFGGVIGGMIMAATPVVVRSFFLDMEKPESKPPSSTPPPNDFDFDSPPLRRPVLQLI
ncbi:hypothetical protein BC332_25154 [Capsicum chinense]|nr:hypothetical protein BC332_25154 [Capsicum chinense]